MTLMDGLIIAAFVLLISACLGFVIRLILEQIYSPVIIVFSLFEFIVFLLFHILLPVIALIVVLSDRELLKTIKLTSYLMVVVFAPLNGLKYMATRMPANFEKLVTVIKRHAENYDHNESGDDQHDVWNKLNQLMKRFG